MKRTTRHKRKPAKTLDEAVASVAAILDASKRAIDAAVRLREAARESAAARAQLAAMLDD